MAARRPGAVEREVRPFEPASFRVLARGHAGARRHSVSVGVLVGFCLAVAAAVPFAPARAHAAVVINEINYHPDTAAEMEEFVELYNTSDTAVSLANWRFVKGITYTFPTTASLPAHGCLVVARDCARIISLFGITDVVGNYVGQLDNGGERLTLVNDVATTIDTVRYNDKWPWPPAADGTGGSLELVNPNGNNDDPRNWRGATAGAVVLNLEHNALTFTHRHRPSGNQPYSMRLSDVPVALNPARSLQSIRLPSRPPRDGQYTRIYIFGLTLVDALGGCTYVNLTSLFNRDAFSFDTDRNDTDNVDGRSSTYPAEELPTSGGLTACQAPGHALVRWRTPSMANGAKNCIRADAQVITVPAGNYVRAHFLATATDAANLDTFVGLNYSDGSVNVPFGVTDWWPGVPVASPRATPGAQNTVYSTITPPYIHDVMHTPLRPTPANAVTVTARVEGTSGIAQVTLPYSVNEGATQTLAMYDDGAHGDGAAGDGIFGALIPPQANQSIVAYRLEARDGAGMTERFPYAGEAEPARSYFVYDGTIATNLPIEWLFIAGADKAWLDDNPNTDETVPATFVDSNGQVYYHVRVRYRGAWARSWPKKCWKLFFNKGNEFNGQGSLDLNSNWNDEILARENLCYEIFRAAGYPASQTRLIQFRLATGGPGQFQGVYVEVEQPGAGYLQRHDLDPNGSFYKAVDNGVYPPRSNESLQPTTLYPTIYEKDTRLWEDYSDLITWTQGIDTATRTATVLPYLNQTTDLWRLGEYLALNTIIANWDHVGKNHYDFRDVLTNKWLQMPWDVDRTLGEYTSPGYRTDQPIDYGRHDVPGPSGMYSFLQDCYFEEPRLLTFHYRMLRRLCNLVFTEERMHAVADRTRALMGTDAQADYNLWQGAASYDNQWAFWRTTQDYVRNRRNFILGRLPAEGDVVINELMTSNTRSVRDPAGHYEDWVELYNPKSTAVNLGGCHLSDNLSSPTRWRFPDNTFIAAHGWLIVWCDGRTTEPGGLHTNFRLDDRGEQIGLFDTDANAHLPIDWWTYGPQVANVSVGRNGDGAWEWVAYTSATAGAANPVRAVGVPPVRFNEWLASNRVTNADEKGEYDDWVELYNTSNEPVCIGGRFLTDGLAKHDSWMIPYATVIAPHGFLVVWCDGQIRQGPLHTDFHLDAVNGGELALYDSNTATLIDSVRFGPQQTDVSQGRFPDGAATSYTLDYPTPGAPNVYTILPAPPFGLAATAVSSSRINLAWIDNSSNEQGFQLERKTGAGGLWSQITTTTVNVSAYPDIGLQPRTTYFYRVRAYNPVGNSPYSNVASTTTFDAPPSAPSNLTATLFLASQINLAWNDNSNNELGFKIERKIGLGGSWSPIATVGAGVTTYPDRGRLLNTTYFYRVRAYNAAGDSAYSNETSKATPAQSRGRRWGQYR